MKYGLIGEKLSHSFSAEIHNRIFGYEYTLQELSPSQLESFLQRREFSGINVTIPYKETVIPHLDYVDDTARDIGAVNTIICRDGNLYGYNTDFVGLQALLNVNNIEIQGKTVLILGSGGTSKTACAVVKRLECLNVFRVSRNAADGCISYSRAKEIAADVQVLINTTPCGMYPNIGESAVDIADFPALEAVVDVVYNPLRSKLVCDANERGIPAVGGLYMLVAQAAAAAELFLNKSVTQEQILATYNQLLKDKQNIVLIGMPSCGKSTIGAALAHCLDCDFVDIDRVIEQEEGRSITDIFAVNGEPYFRTLENAAIYRFSKNQHTVIATGGGAVLDARNISLLRENGWIVFLDRSLDKLIATDDRPLSSNSSALEQRYKERYSLYCKACDIRIDANGSIVDVVESFRKEIHNEKA